MFKLISLILLLSLVSLSLSNLYVYSPPAVRTQFDQQNNSIEYSIARYGYVPYGKKLIGQLYYADPPSACSPLNSSTITFHGNENDPRNQPIMLVERGYCTFVTKTKQAQLIGAKLVIVIDNKQEFQWEAIMADDGRGGQITIPTVLISQEDGAILKQNLQQNPDIPISMSIVFPMKKKVSQVKIDYWFTSSDLDAYRFIANMADYLWEFGGSIDFRPHFVTWFCSSCESTNFTAAAPDCLSSGRYCAPDPDNLGPLNGAWVVRQDLHHLCIYKTWGIDGYLNWILRVAEKCVDNTTLPLQCTEEELSYFDWDPIGLTKYKACMLASFDGQDEDSDNILLAAERDYFQNSDVPYWPVILIDHVAYKGELFPVENVAAVICDQLNADDFDMCKDVQSNLQANVVVHEDSNVGMVVTICLAFVVIIVFFLCYYKKVVRKELTKEMGMQMHQMISDYAAFRDKSSLIGGKGDPGNL